MNEIQKTTNSIIDLGRLVLVAIIMIVLVILVAKALLRLLISESLAIWGSYILGIVSLFVIIVSKKVRRKISSFGK